MSEIAEAVEVETKAETKKSDLSSETLTEEKRAMAKEKAGHIDQSKLIDVSKETQALTLRDHTQLARFVDQLILAKAIPRHLQNREQVIAAWNFAAQLMLPPQPSLRNIAVIEGTPSLFGDLPLALVQRHKEFMYYEEFNIDADYNRICFENKNLTSEVFGGIVLLQRKGMKQAQSFAFVKTDAERAGILRRAKPGMPWQAYPQVMYIRRARIMAIRALFADAITGSQIAEEFGYAPDLRDVTPHTNTLAGELNNVYLEKDAEPRATTEVTQ